MTASDPLDRLAGSRGRSSGRPGYHDGLSQCDDLLVAAATRVATSLPVLADALLAGDDSAGTAGAVLSEGVSASCNEVEDRCLLLIAREAPVGRDLRLVVAMLRLAPRVHRAAQLTRHVPEALPLLGSERLPTSVLGPLRELIASATAVFADGVEAWRLQDGLAVNEVAARDRSVDRARSAVLAAAVQAHLPPEANIALGLLARYLERIGDHGVAMARDATFVATGERVTVVA